MQPEMTNSTPIVRGMARIKPKDRARKRILSDDEIRIIWPVLGRLAFSEFGQNAVAYGTAARRGRPNAQKGNW